MRETLRSFERNHEQTSTSAKKLDITFLESLILAQDERWRRA